MVSATFLGVSQPRIGAELGLALGAAMAGTAETIGNNLPVVRSFSDQYHLDIPLAAYASGGIDVDRWREGIVPLFAERIRRHFNSRIEMLPKDKTPFQQFCEEGLDQVDLVHVVGAGLVGADFAFNALYRVIGDIERQIGMMPEEMRHAHPYYRAATITPRVMLYAAATASLVYAHRLPPGAFWAITAATGPSILLFEGFLHGKDKAANAAFLEAGRRHASSVAELAPTLEHLREAKAAVLELKPKKVVPSLAYPEGRIPAIQLQSAGRAWARIVTGLSDLTTDYNPKYVVVELPSGQFEIRIVNPDRKHFQIVLPGEKIAGAGYLEYRASERLVRVDGLSASYTTKEDDVEVPHNAPDLKARRIGLGAVADIFRQVLGGETRVETAFVI